MRTLEQRRNSPRDILHKPSRMYTVTMSTRSLRSLGIDGPTWNNLFNAEPVEGAASLLVDMSKAELF